MLIDPLEPRTLLAASYTFESNILSIRGSNRADDIQVSAASDLAGDTLVVRLNGKIEDLIEGVQMVPLDQIIIRARGGHDRIRVGQTFRRADVTVRGGSGADEIILDATPTAYPAFISGDRGPDYIRLAGGGGSDGHPVNDAGWGYPALIRGGTGDDHILVYSQPDPGFGVPKVAGMRIFGDSGNDRILSGAGDDFADAGAGDDTITSLTGDDTLRGRQGDDQLTGGAGDDHLLGGPGDNVLTQDSKPKNPNP